MGWSAVKVACHRPHSSDRRSGKAAPAPAPTLASLLSCRPPPPPGPSDIASTSRPAPIPARCSLLSERLRGLPPGHQRHRPSPRPPAVTAVIESRYGPLRVALGRHGPLPAISPCLRPLRWASLSMSLVVVPPLETDLETLGCHRGRRRGTYGQLGPTE